MRDRVGTLDDDERCNRCGGENIGWAAPSPLWNLVMRGNDINAEPRHRDLVCMRCFAVLAWEEGLVGRWRLYLDPEPDGLVKVTPSGRVWDADKWLWVEPEEWRPGDIATITWLRPDRTTEDCIAMCLNNGDWLTPFGLTVDGDSGWTNPRRMTITPTPTHRPEAGTGEGMSG